MTLKDDTIMVGDLRPVERKIFDIGWSICTNPKSPCSFSYRDFPSIPHGTFRNAISRLAKVGLVYRVHGGHPTQYGCKGSGIKPMMTLPPVAGRRRVTPFEEILLLLGNAIAGVHDIRMVFDLPSFYKDLQLIPQNHSKDKRLSPLRFSRRIIRITAHITGSVSVLLACSDKPFPRDDLTELFLLLERAKEHLQFECLGRPIRVPLIGDWIVTQWHYNKDGDEIALKPLMVTFRDFSEVLCRFYGKPTPDHKYIPRFEKQVSPQRSLRELAATSLRDHDERFR